MSDKPEESEVEPEDVLEKELEAMRDAEDPEPEEVEQEKEADAVREDAESEADADKEQESEPEKEQPDSVPLNVFLDQKRQAKELNRELTSLKEQMTSLLTTVKEATGDKGEEEPSLADNPVEHLAYQSQQVKQQVADLKAAITDDRQRNQMQAVQNEINGIEATFAAKQPDYWEATKHLADHRINELQDVFGFSEEEAQQRFSEETARFINAATSQGKSFAEQAYKMAQAYGFKSSTAAKAEEPEESKSDKSLKALARKQAQAKTLASTGGTTPKEDVSPEDALDLNDEDFDKQFTGEEGDKRLKELFGG